MAADGWLQGTVLRVDRFGNVVTNIGRALLTSFLEGDLNSNLVVKIQNKWTLPMALSYSAVPTGGLLAIIGSRDTLEIAVNQGNAGRLIGVAAGDEIRVAPEC